uniref:Uncharacterized protein n=1 Tax=Meloidogyne hapla TaxID=6305 RepID=A0A1I8BBI1_MELHA
MGPTRYILFQLVFVIIVNQGFVNGLPRFHNDTFDIACSRLYGPETEPSHSDIIYSINYYRLYGLLNLKGKSSRETIWVLLAKLLVPLPRWNRGEILLKFCRSVGYVDTTHERGKQLKNCFNDLFDRNSKGFAGMKKGRMYNEAATLYKNMILDKSTILGEMLFKALESNDMKTIYKIFFAHPRHEILPIIEKQIEFYPYEENIKNLYLNKKVSEERGEIILIKHINLKKLEADDSTKLVYDLLLKRIDAMIGKRLLGDHDYIANYLRKICGLSTTSGIDESNFNTLIEYIENLLILGQDTPLEQNLIKQIYFIQLKEIMEIAMLMEGEKHYTSRSKKELQTLHNKGKHDGVIKFLFLHLEDDMRNIIEVFKNDDLEKDLKKFDHRRFGVNNFHKAYINVLSEIQDENKNCYTVTEEENKLVSELKLLELKNEARYSRISKLLLVLIEIIWDKYKGTLAKPQKLDELQIPKINHLIKVFLHKYLYNVNSSELDTSMDFSNLIREYSDELLKEIEGCDDQEKQFIGMELMNDFIIKEIKDFIETLDNFKEKLTKQEKGFSDDDKMFHEKIEELKAKVEKIQEKYSSPFIKIIIDKDIRKLDINIIKDELERWRKYIEASSSVRFTSEEFKTNLTNFEVGETSSSEHEVIKKG